MQDNGHSLKSLAQESRVENQIMRRLTEKGTRDASAVKAITVITILYLPTTVVAVSFFDFVSTQKLRHPIGLFLDPICLPRVKRTWLTKALDRRKLVALRCHFITAHHCYGIHLVCVG
jgi:hypothetical protein